MRYRLTVEDICKKLKPLFGKKIDDIYLRYAMAESREEREEISSVLNALYNKNLTDLLETKILLQPPEEGVLDGTYNLASVSYAGKRIFPFNLREQDWPRHVCISGMSGGGKTTLALNILTNFVKHNKPFLVFDWKKSFRPLLLASSDVMAFTIGNEAVTNTFKMNINRPPTGIDPKEWINVLCDLLTESFFVSFGVHKVLLETLDEAFAEWKVYEGSERYPTWNHIKWYLEEKLNKTRGREAGWLESALRIASVLTFGNFGKICNSQEEDSLTIEDLLKKQVIFELNALSNIEKKVFCEYVLTYIYKLKKSKQDTSDSFDHAILVDEAHNIFLKESTHFAKESVTDMVYREMREYGTSLICLDQHISKLSDTVKGNSACHIAFQQQLPADIFDISGIMQLREEREFFSMLPVGSAIVKLSERYPYPFLVEVTQSPLRKETVTDEQVKDRTKCHIMGIEVEKEIDPEFNKELIPEPVKQPEIVKVENPGKPQIKQVEAKPIEIIQEPVPELKEQPQIEKPKDLALTPTQKILFDFIKKKYDEGRDLAELEDMLEEVKEEGGYTLSDIVTAVNFVLTGEPIEEEPKKIQPSKKIKIYKEETPTYTKKNESNDEQEMFLSFLQANQDNTYGTTDVYRILGLSARKGNQVKNKLLAKNLIMITEEKNDKGWKKIIQLDPSTN